MNDCFLKSIRSVILRDRFWQVAAAVSVILHVLHLVFVSRNPTYSDPIIDSREYIAQARLILESRFETAFHSPLYTWLLALVFWVCGTKLLVIRVAQIALNVLTGALTYVLARKLFDERSGRVSLVVWTFYGPVIFFGGEILPVSLILCTCALALGYLVYALDAPARIRMTLAGGLVCLAALARADILPFAGLLFLLVLVRATRIRLFPRLDATDVLRFGAGFLATAALAGAITYAVAGKSTLMPVNSGINFYIGNNPEHRDTIGIRPGRDWDRLQLVYMKKNATLDRRARNLETGSYFYEEAFRYIRSEPLGYLRCVVFKIRTLVGGYELPATLDVYTFRSYSPVLDALVWRIGPVCLPYGLVLPLALVGMGCHWKRRAALAIPLLFLLCSLAGLLVYWNSARYRMAIVPVLIVFAGAAIIRVRDRVDRRRFGSCLWLVLLLTVVSIVSNFPYPHFSKSYDYDAEMLLAVGVQRMNRGDTVQGMGFIRRSLKQSPSYVDAWVAFGVACEKLQRFEEAVKAYEEAISFSPDDHSAHANLGAVLLRAYQLPAAQVHLEKAIALHPYDALTRFRLGQVSQIRGRHLDALALFREALALDADRDVSDDIRFRMGQAFEALGWMGDAVRSYEAALELDPQHEGAADHLAALKAKTQGVKNF